VWQSALTLQPQARAQQELQEKLANVKEAVAKNQAALRQYAWTEQTNVLLKGEVKKTTYYQCQYGVPTLAPIGHFVGVEELESKIKAAHLDIFFQVPDQLVLQGVRVTPLQRPRWIVRRRYSRMLHNIDRSVTKRYGAPIAQLLIRLDCLA
jgi:hypothetical protein